MYVITFLIEIQHTESARPSMMKQPGFSVASKTGKAQVSPERVYKNFLLQNVVLLPFCCNYFKFCPSSLIPSLFLFHFHERIVLSSTFAKSRASMCSEDLHTDMLFAHVVTMGQREQLIIVIKHKFSLGVILTYWLGHQSKNNSFFFLMEISWCSSWYKGLFDSKYLNMITHTKKSWFGLC